MHARRRTRQRCRRALQGPAQLLGLLRSPRGCRLLLLSLQGGAQGRKGRQLHTIILAAGCNSQHI
jgi:hypothetical protein